MNRIEFMAELEALLKDVSAEEREEAVQYYRDYFEDAGLENEQHIISELESPQKVAKTIKEGLRGKNDESSEYRETGYADTRFEEKETPAKRNNETEETKKEGSDRLLKILLIAAIVLVGIPVLIPLAIAVICVVLALAFSGFAVLAGLVLAAGVVAIVGVTMVVSGIITLFTFPALGLTVSGAGLIILVLGMIATVLLIKLCTVAFPPMFRWLVDICRKPFHRRGQK